jgi:hypothetical protein
MTTAASISRKLRSLGFNPVAASDRSRQGLRVTGGAGGVRVSADLDNPSEAQALGIAARQAIMGAGYHVRCTDNASFHVLDH